MLADLIRSGILGTAQAAVDTARRTPVIKDLIGKDLELAGKTVFVTGAARGLGAELARQAYEGGANVALVGRTLPPLQEAAEQLGPNAAAFEADVTDLAALQKAAEAADEMFGSIDIVIANAGIAPPARSVLTIDPDEFERVVDVDLLGQWRTIRATLPMLIENQGHVLVVASVYAFFNGAMNASYAASKAGIEQLTRAVRVEVARHGVTAGVAYLGFVDTDLAADAFAQEQVAEARKALPAFVTKPITVEHAARELIKGIERRAPRVGAPAWVLPMLAVRGSVTSAMDHFMLFNPGLRRAMERAEKS